MMIALLLAFAVAPAPPGNPPPSDTPPGDTAPITLTDAEFCDGAQIAVATLQATYPKQVDVITRLEKVSIDCPARTMEWNGSVSVNQADMRPDWMTERQTAWNAQSCSGAVLIAARQGWHFRQTYRFKDGTLSSIDAACP